MPHKDALLKGGESESLVALCGALEHGRSAPESFGESGSVLATLCTEVPDGESRIAALSALARHGAVRAALTPSTIPGIRAFACGSTLSLIGALVWADSLRWATSGYGVIYQLMEKLARAPLPTLAVLTVGLLVAYRTSLTRPVQALRAALLWLLGLPYRQSVRALDAEGALAAAAAGSIPASSMPRWVLKLASPERLAIAEAGTCALAQLEYQRALARALTVRWYTELCADLAQGGAFALVILALAAVLL